MHGSPAGKAAVAIGALWGIGSAIPADGHGGSPGAVEAAVPTSG